MSETFRTTPPDQQWSSQGYSGQGYGGAHSDDGDRDSGTANDAGKALLVGVLGGLLSAAGYLVFQRLPEDQKSRLQSQAKQLLQERISDIRRNFNV